MTTTVRRRDGRPEPAGAGRTAPAFGQPTDEGGADPREGLRRALRFCAQASAVSPHAAGLRASLAQGLMLLEGTVRAADRIRACLDEADGLVGSALTAPIFAGEEESAAALRGSRYAAVLARIDRHANEPPPGTAGPSLLVRGDGPAPEMVLDRDGKLRHVLRRLTLTSEGLGLVPAEEAFSGRGALLRARAAVTAARERTDAAAAEFCKDAAMIAGRLSDLMPRGG